MSIKIRAQFFSGFSSRFLYQFELQFEEEQKSIAWQRQQYSDIMSLTLLVVNYHCVYAAIQFTPIKIILFSCCCTVGVRMTFLVWKWKCHIADAVEMIYQPFLLLPFIDEIEIELAVFCYKKNKCILPLCQRKNEIDVYYSKWIRKAVHQKYSKKFF